MADDLGSSGLGKIGNTSDLGSSGGLGDSKAKKTVKYILIIAAILGILSAVGIFIQILSIDPGFEVPIGVEKLGILAGLCAFITGIDTLYNTFKKRSEI